MHTFVFKMMPCNGSVMTGHGKERTIHGKVSGKRGYLDNMMMIKRMIGKQRKHEGSKQVSKQKANCS